MERTNEKRHGDPVLLGEVIPAVLEGIRQRCNAYRQERGLPTLEEELDGHEAQLLTTREVASLLKVAPATLVDWRHSRQGPKYYKMGREIRYKLTDIAEWEEKALVLVEPMEL